MTFGPDVHAFSQQEAPKILEYKDLFDNNTIGRLPVVYHMCLDDAVLPAVCTRLGVITVVQEPTEWVSAMVAVKKRDGSIRLCIDPANLNRALLRPHHPLKTVEEIIA